MTEDSEPEPEPEPVSNSEIGNTQEQASPDLSTANLGTTHQAEANMVSPVLQQAAPTPAPAPKPRTEAERNKAIKQNAAAMVRCRITCMNPNKKEWEGEIFTAGNRVVGTHRKFIPFNREWHVPRIIFNMIRDRQCQVFETKRDRRTGVETRTGRLIQEFAIEVLPALNQSELDELARRQAMEAGQNPDD